jgi:hypothetical protein
MIVGIRVESENIQTGAKKTLQFLLFYHGIEDNNGKIKSSGLILLKLRKALYKYLKQISLKKKRPPRGKFRLQFKGSMG